MKTREDYARKLIENMYETLKEYDHFTSDYSVGIYGDDEMLHRYNVLQSAYKNDVNPLFICNECYNFHPNTDCPLTPPED